jgi:hypothetical protein
VRDDGTVKQDLMGIFTSKPSAKMDGTPASSSGAQNKMFWPPHRTTFLFALVTAGTEAA